MSKDGRAQNAVYEILEGYSTQTDFIQGPMYKHPDLSKTVRHIVDALRNIYSSLPESETTMSDIIIPNEVRSMNRERCDRWHPPTGDDWTLGDWSNAFMGEGGELANVVKKLRRHQSGHATSYNTPEVETLRDRFAEEVADVLLYLDLLCWKAGVEPEQLLDALCDKFDAVSRAQGWDDLTLARYREAREDDV